MLNLINLSDAQSELMQGGRRPGRDPKREKCCGGDKTTNTTTVRVKVDQRSDGNMAMTMGKTGTAYNDVYQYSSITIL